jgi:geranylgeranyl pyrophosphate synthase
MTRAGIPGLEAPDAALEAELRRRLDDVEVGLQKAVRADSDFLTETALHLIDAGGKRFRPMLVLLSGYFGEPTDPRLVPGAVAIELTHLATLYHDDVIDEAEFRRGRASANARWDNTVAILTGDYLFARASEISAELGPDVSKLLARTIATVCDGQIREVGMAGRLDQNEDSYMEAIDRKTAALIATSCRLGGMLSDASEDHVDVLERFGSALGLGFQLSDDIMDVISTERVLGKEPGVDIKEGVYTLPVIQALEVSEELRELLSDGPPDDAALSRALQIVGEDGILARARAAVTREVRRAVSLAEELPTGDARTALVHLAEFIAARCGAES